MTKRLTSTPSRGRFRGRKPRRRKGSGRVFHSDFTIYLWKLRKFGPGHRFLEGKAAEGGYFQQPVVRFRGRRYRGWNKRVGTMRPIMRLEWRD